MKKVTWLIVCVGVLMTVGLLKVIFDGVHLEQRQMVKWSKVDSAHQAGQKIGRFLFPLIQEKKRVKVEGAAPFAQSFFTSFQKEAMLNNSTSQIFWGNDPSEESEFKLIVKPLQAQQDKGECQKGNSLLCSELKAYQKYKKLKEKGSFLWISMYRLAEEEAVLFYENEEESQ